MSGIVLLATPARKSTPAQLLARHQDVASSLMYPGMEWRLYLNEQPAMRGKYGPNAAARNQLIERYLRPQHEWVLWLDVDIVAAPPDLPRRLMEISLAHDKAIVAPLPYVEMARPGPVNLHNGGWFYDTGGFQTAGGVFADATFGIPGNGEVVEMNSVGCCYLAPAAVYRQGARYRPRGEEVEHLSFCREARRLGTRVLAARELQVTHAYLPTYGEAWHS